MSPVRTIDTRHVGRERVIAAFTLEDCLVDCGPSTVIDHLVAELGDDVPRRLLLTHIHLDHSGGAGQLVRRFPDLEVVVHARGARHLADPEKLVSSASRLYGDDMEKLWGEIVPVPEENLRIVSGGEELEGGWRVAYTPGHASHHVSFLHEPTGTAFTGDTAGVRIPPGPLMAPTPPPDIDLEAWPHSLDLIAGWRPERIAVSHFGVWEDPEEHLAAMREALERQTRWAREAPDGDAFARRLREHLAAETDPATAEAYEQGMPPDHLYPGMERALRRVSSPQ